MLVKCRVCGAQIERSTAYKVQHGKVNHYYCSQQEYDTNQEIKRKNAESKDQTYQLINEIFGRKVINSALFKELNNITAQYGYSLIAQYLASNKGYLSDAMGKDFVSEYAQIRYFAAILRNSIYDFKRKNKVEPIKKVDFEYGVSNYKQRAQRTGFAEIE